MCVDTAFRCKGRTHAGALLHNVGAYRGGSNGRTRCQAWQARGSKAKEPESARSGVRRGAYPKAAFASEDWYDVWFPNLAPSLETLKSGQAAHDSA